MKRATATALSCVVLGWFYFTHLDDPLARQTAYPFNYRDVVMAAAEKEQVPPSLVASVILAESKYKNTAESETESLSGDGLEVFAIRKHLDLSSSVTALILRHFR